MEDPEIRDLIVRSRPVILEIVENRGYNVDSYKAMSSKEIDAFATSNIPLLKIQAEKLPDGPAPVERLEVLYWMDSVKSRIETELNNLLTDLDVTKTEFIILLSEPPHESFHRWRDHQPTT